MNRRFLIALFVNITIPLGGISTDIYLPSLPAMVDFFGTTSMVVQLTVTFFALGLGIGQAVAGPVSDAIGRKRPYLFGMLMQIISVVAILLTSSSFFLIVSRLIQGFGAAFMMVPARVMLNDVFDGEALKKQYTYITAAFALGPIVAPFIGGYLQHFISWQANFYLVFLYLLLLTLTMTFFIKETIVRKKPFSSRHVLESYFSVLQNKLFLTASVLVSFFLGYVAIFNVVGPFMIQKILQKSPVFYGYLALIMGVAWFSGNMTSRVFFRYSRRAKSTFMLSVMLMAAFLMFACSFFGVTLLTLVVPVFVMIFCGGFLFPIYVGECLAYFREQAASANGLLFALIWMVFSLFSFIGTLLKVHALAPLAACYLIITMVLYAWFLLAARKY